MSRFSFAFNLEYTMLNTRLFVVLFIWVVVAVNGYPFLGSLTEDECKACEFFFFETNLVDRSSDVQIDSLSEDIHDRLHAMFVCPKKWRLKSKVLESAISKRSVPEVSSHEEEVDDSYLFWWNVIFQEYELFHLNSVRGRLLFVCFFL